MKEIEFREKFKDRKTEITNFVLRLLGYKTTNCRAYKQIPRNMNEVIQEFNKRESYPDRYTNDNKTMELRLDGFTDVKSSINYDVNQDKVVKITTDFDPEHETNGIVFLETEIGEKSMFGCKQFSWVMKLYNTARYRMNNPEIILVTREDFPVALIDQKKYPESDAFILAPRIER
ncbi:MAG: hypothetical protein ACOC1X_01375 [Promethearchaeota archaeon]